MGLLDPKKILKRVEKEGFEKVWRESANMFPKPIERKNKTPVTKGVSHPLYDLIQKLRTAFINLGFNEVFNPVILDETEIFKQYGPEAPIILDRCYYLATLPRPDIGLGRDKIEKMKKLGVEITEAKVLSLQKVFRDYKKGKIDSDDLVEKIADSIGVSDTLAMRVISEVFPEFTSLLPVASKLTLRSHITTAWFLTLQALRPVSDLPLKLFSVDIRFRREQREDPTHLRVHHSASCVVMKETIDVGEGEEISRSLLEPLGFNQFKFVQKKVTSKYYAPGMEYEGFVFNPSSKNWIEVVDYGIYSPIALAKYDLDCPVLNVGIGVERVAMLLYNETDIRRLVYPQFFAELRLSDQEIAQLISLESEPKTEEGKKIIENLLNVALANAEAHSPCEFLVYEGKIFDKHVKVYLYENEENAKLLGAAALNQIVVYDGNVLGIPMKGKYNIELVKTAREKGISTGIRYIDGIAAKAASEIEEAVTKGQKSFNMWVRMAKRPSDINVKVSDKARRYIMNQKKKIETTGPVFVGVRAEIMD
ncbi:MAG: O-phosphoserine--tRNA ligase [Candidatus Bathyarchaeia archaeon]